jgi:uncharacterized protein (TIGR02594 family)
MVALSLPAFSRPNPAIDPQDPEVRVVRIPQAAPGKAAKPKLTYKKRIHRHPHVLDERANEFERDDRYPHLDQPQTSSPSQPGRAHSVQSSSGWSSALIGEARKYLGTNPTSRKRLWCARFMNFVLAKVGFAGTGSDAAKSFAHYGQRISEPKVGAIAVLTRGKRGGHVGIVTGFDKRGNPILLSGNHGRRVGYGVYARSRVIAYVMPTRQHGRPIRQSENEATDTVPQRSTQVVQVAQRQVQQIGQQQIGQRPAAQRAVSVVVRQQPVPQRPVQVAQNTRPSGGKPSIVAEFEMLMARVGGR